MSDLAEGVSRRLHNSLYD